MNPISSSDFHMKLFHFFNVFLLYLNLKATCQILTEENSGKIFISPLTQAPKAGIRLLLKSLFLSLRIKKFPIHPGSLISEEVIHYLYMIILCGGITILHCWTDRLLLFKTRKDGWVKERIKLTLCQAILSIFIQKSHMMCGTIGLLFIFLPKKMKSTNTSISLRRRYVRVGG